MTTAAPAAPPTQAASQRARVVEVANLTYGYGDGRTVLRDVSLTLEEGEIVILSGPSGSGKSTLMSLIGLLRRPPPGAVRLFGMDAGAADAARLLHMRRRLRFIFQRHYLVRSLTALQNVVSAVVMQEASDGAWNRIRAEQFLSAMGLGDHLQKWPEQLSGGQQQRVAVARALVALPDLLLADEPTASLDYDSARLVVDRIRDLAGRLGCAVILATHDDRIMDIATRRVRLADGRLAP